MNKTYWPLSFAELDLEGGNGIEVEDIAEYAYPPGDKRRYKEIGWRKAINLGIANVGLLDVRDFSAVPHNGDLVSE